MKLLKVFASVYFWLVLIIISGFALRLYKIDSPIADWHSWRQADTAAVTRNFIKYGFNPFVPRYDDMSGVSEKPIANPAAFRFVEFPVYNIATYPFYLFFGMDDRYHRLVSILFSLGSTIMLFFIVKKYAGSMAGLLSAFTFSHLPFNVFFSRTTLPEPTFVFFSLGMLYFTDRWIERNTLLSLIIGFIFTVIAFLMKPWAIFFYLPLLYSAIRKNKKFFLKFILFSALAVTPFILWRLWMLQEPQGIPASSWLLNSDGIRFKPAFWWWLVSERIGREILGATGIVLFIIGILTRPKNKNYFLHIWLLSAFLFMSIFATGNVRHNYYQISFVPIASVFFSLGFMKLFEKNDSFLPRFWTITVALLLLPLAFYFTWKIDKEFYKINNPDIVEAGKTADQILPKDAIVVAPYNGDTAFLYQTNRKGWATTALPLAEMVADYGVTSYVSTARDAKTNWVLRHFSVLLENPRFIIADLTKITSPFSSSDPEP